MKSINLILINFFIIIYPWGRFLDKLIFGNIEYGAKGLSTIVLLFIIIFSFFSGTINKGLNKVPNKFLISIFLLFTLIATIISKSPEKLFSDFINLVIYFLLIFVFVGINLSKNQIYRLIKLLMFSTFLMCIFSLLDFFNIIQIPYFNDSISNVSLGNQVIFDLTGPFVSRTDIGLHLALMFFIPILFIFSKKKTFFTFLIYGSIFFTFIITGFFSNSRSIFLSLIICTIYFIIISFKHIKKAKIIFWLTFISFISCLVLFNFSFDSLIDVSTLLNRDYGGSSDWTRFYAFTTTLIDVIENPVGVGFDRPYIEEIAMYQDVHNTYTFLLRCGGFIGFISLCYFFRPLFKKILNFRVSINELLFVTPVISVLVFGFFHTSIQFSTFWILVAISYSSIYNNKVV